MLVSFCRVFKALVKGGAWTDVPITARIIFYNPQPNNDARPCIETQYFHLVSLEFATRCTKLLEVVEAVDKIVNVRVCAFLGSALRVR